MLALLLRTILLVEFVALAAMYPWFSARVGGVAAVLSLVALFLAVQSLLLLAGYVVAARHASARPPGIGPVTPRAVLVEWLSFFALFAFILPFERWWMGSDRTGRLPDGRLPVLLVHGYMCNRGFWWWFRRRLRERGFAVATVNLETPFSDIDILADQLDRRIEALAAETGAPRVTVVSHSMGGLVTRAYVRRKGAGRIARFVCIAAPHHGTAVAQLGIGTNARQMEPGSEWIEALNREPPLPVPVLSIWSAGDEVVSPQASSRLEGAREAVLPATGHIAMAFSRPILDLVVADLAGGPSATGGAPS